MQHIPDSEMQGNIAAMKYAQQCEHTPELRVEVRLKTGETVCLRCFYLHARLQGMGLANQSEQEVKRLIAAMERQLDGDNRPDSGSPGRQESMPARTFALDGGH